MNTPETVAGQAIRSTPLLALFAGHRYYPRGGANDFRAFANTRAELEALFAKSIDQWMEDQGDYKGTHWGQIADAQTMKVIAEKSDDEPWHTPGDPRFF